MTETCDVCGRPAGLPEDPEDTHCYRSKWNVFDRERCYQLGYERLKSRVAELDAERDRLIAERNEMCADFNCSIEDFYASYIRCERERDEARRLAARLRDAAAKRPHPWESPEGQRSAYERDAAIEAALCAIPEEWTP